MNFKGRIIDKVSKVGLPMANIFTFIEDDKFGMPKGGMSNGDGDFDITFPEGTKSIIAKYMGYKDQIIQPGKSEVTIIEMEPIAVQGDETVITATATTVPKKRPFPKEILIIGLVVVSLIFLMVLIKNSSTKYELV